MRKSNRTKKFIATYFLIGIMFFLSGCGHLRNFAPILKTVKEGEELILIYNEERYISTDFINNESLVNEDGIYLNYEKLILIGVVFAQAGLFKLPVYVSNIDKDANVLYIVGGPRNSYYIKETLVFPDIYTTEIANIFITLNNVSELEAGERQYLSPLWNGLVYSDIIEEEIVYKDISEWYSGKVYFELLDYKYLKVLDRFIVNVDGELYLTQEVDQWYRENGKVKVKDSAYCQRIKSEYQEIFKTAIEELNKMQS